jgi:glycosyltransferase involved in cell wall biosynthesis
VKVAVIVPTLGRPERVGPVTDDILAASKGHDVTVVFVAEAHDAVTIEAVTQHPTAELVINTRRPSYAGAVNSALHETTEPWVFCAADDLHFHPGWLDALEPLTKAFKVLGTNDLGNPEVLAAEHATHYLVERTYALTAVVDQPGSLLYEGYVHNYTDKELVETAKARGVFTPCLDSIVEHNHWLWNKAPLDDTYDKGRQSEPDDRRRHEARVRLWAGA